ncbi:hypothetical protein GJ496_006079 [Pomphorhynchus laevis]|nr:hypothetical protein GJ496_006079 [Pomphorhynchus laevis]
MRNFPLQIPETDKILPLKKNGKFSHPWPTESLSYWNLFKWTTTRKNPPAPTASDLDAIHSNDMPALSQTDSISSKYIMWLGHSSVLLRLNNKTFLFDPIFSQRAPAIYGPTRYRDSLVQSKENLSGVDYVLISHSH